MADSRQALAPGADADADLVLASYAAFASGDIEAAVGPITETTEWVEPEGVDGGARRVGREAVAGYLRASRDTWRVLRSEARAFRIEGRIVVLHELSGVLIDGSAATAQVADVYEVEDGAVRAMHATTDIDAALRGVWPSP